MGEKIAGMLEAQGIDVWAFEAAGETRTNLKVVDPELDTHTDINEPGPLASIAQLDAMREELAEKLVEGDIVVLSGSLPKGAPVATYAAWARSCSAAGAKVFLDADGDALTRGLDASPYLVKPNDAELSRLCGRELAGEGGRRGRGTRPRLAGGGARGRLHGRCGRRRGGRGPGAPRPLPQGGGGLHRGAPATPWWRRSAFAEERGMSLGDATRLAMATGAANVMQSGTQAAERSLVTP